MSRGSTDLPRQQGTSLDPAPGQWQSIAADWTHIGPPLRPCRDDLLGFLGALRLWGREHPGRVPAGLILGVTPELYHLPWPRRDRVRAVDRTESMIRSVWPGDLQQALLSDWRRTGLSPASVDIALCDGGFHLLGFPDGQHALCQHLAHVLAPGGIAAFRLFVPPVERESADAVIAALLRGEIANLNCLKLRLGMALQEDPERGVVLARVWERLRGLVRHDWSELAEALGWSLEHLRVVDGYRDSEAAYHFVGAEQAIDTFSQAGFVCISLTVQQYELGERCPIVVFRRC